MRDLEAYNFHRTVHELVLEFGATAVKSFHIDQDERTLKVSFELYRRPEILDKPKPKPEDDDEIPL